jgi:hypothetical protein
LKTKYNAALDLYDDMCKPLPRKRPNCEEVLKKKDLWALNEEELDINEKLRDEIISKLNDENQTVFSLLKQKLKI